MMNLENMNALSIEQFAAYLDGNLAEEEMQQVAAIIESDKALSGILGNVMEVDEMVETAMAHPDEMLQEMAEMKVDLPLVPTLVGTADELELAATIDSDTVTTVEEDYNLAEEAVVEEDAMSNQQGLQDDSSAADIGGCHDMDPMQDEMVDLGD